MFVADLVISTHDRSLVGIPLQEGQHVDVHGSRHFAAYVKQLPGHSATWKGRILDGLLCDFWSTRVESFYMSEDTLAKGNRTVLPTMSGQDWIWPAKSLQIVFLRTLFGQHWSRACTLSVNTICWRKHTGVAQMVTLQSDGHSVLATGLQTACQQLCW